jgi:hypothetical protein
MEDIVGNRVNVMSGRSEVGTSRRQRSGEAASNQERKQASKQQASKQAVGVNELSWREDEGRLQSVAYWRKAAVNVTTSSTGELINMMELIGVGLRSVMMVGSGVGGMKLIDGQRWK